MKRILIFTQQEERSSDDVILWLQTLDCHVDRLNLDDLILGMHVDSNRHILFYHNKSVDLQQYDAIWCRRSGGTSFGHYNNNSVQEQYNKYFIQYEFQALYKYLDAVVASKKNINKLSDWENDKLTQLMLAKQAGFNVPDWRIISDVRSLKAYIKESGIVITKALNIPFFEVNTQEINCSVNYGTNLVDEASVNSFEKERGHYFYPTFFQKYIEKAYELRVFYLDGQMYAMAIFSQKNSRTKVDFRNYDRELPNRTVPYKLPEVLKDTIRKFMKSAGLNSGSLDLIYAPEKEYFFLEVNPAGQYKWLSTACNYYIEKDIAHYLYE